VIELTSGCICCSLSGDFKQTLNHAWNHFQPFRILIEASGTEMVNFVGGKSEYTPWDGEPQTRLVFIG